MSPCLMLELFLFDKGMIPLTTRMLKRGQPPSLAPKSLIQFQLERIEIVG